MSANARHTSTVQNGVKAHVAVIEKDAKVLWAALPRVQSGVGFVWVWGSRGRSPHASRLAGLVGHRVSAYVRAGSRHIIENERLNGDMSEQRLAG
jgi:hypothetical protein